MNTHFSFYFTRFFIYFSLIFFNLCWPLRTAVADLPLLPGHRIVAFYGNFYSTQMGVLGQYPPEKMLEKLQSVVAEWENADPQTPVIPAIDYIVVTAQKEPGSDGQYRLRMPFSQIDKAIDLAAAVNGLVFLDVQVGLSSLQKEVPRLENYLKLPQVHLAIDPEFAMHGDQEPGDVIGSLDAKEINGTIEYLANLVRENNLPPKILVIHRFTQHMVTNYQNIETVPEVTNVMDMDGWGSPAKKINTYNQIVAPEVIQFTGFKLFYKNDLWPPSTGMMKPAQVLNLDPVPLFIQYQ